MTDTGARVFLDYDQPALDRAYEQKHWAPNMPALLERFARDSEAGRARLGRPRPERYGPSAIETLDVYRAPAPRAPVLVFLHGGAWVRGSAAASAFAAETVLRAGTHFVVPDFAPVTEVGLDGMVAQVRRAVAWVARHAAGFGGDPGRLYVAGHSSGAHLAGNVFVTDWRPFDLPADIVKGGLCVSGMYDLKAPRLSSRSAYVPFDDRIEHEYSAQRHLARLGCPVIVAHGEHESPEFQRQSREFAAALAAIGRLHRHLVGKGLNHFELIATLADPAGLIGRAALEMMRLV
ncbi:MAG TPA: alpha/beta hydrolase [Candidatus Limnocylindria bacterium]|nr:alpha/beta hydrolase [Candidatus Limnocylindria bacterium]